MCGRLVANVVTAYNSILSQTELLNRYRAEGNQKALDMLKTNLVPSPGQHYAFRDKQHPIDMEAMLAGVSLQ